MLNWKLMANPYNWIIVFLMVLVGALALKYVGISTNIPPANPAK